MELTVDNNIDNNINTLSNNIIIKKQNEFLQTDLGKTINTAVDIGIKAVLPDLVENQVIEIKDAILENGFKEGLKEAINQGIQMGKSISGIFTGNFESISQVQDVVRSGGILDNVSKLLDYAIKFAENKNLINHTVAKMIKQGKNTILDSVNNKIEESLTNQLKSIEKLKSYCEKWKSHYENKDFEKMESSYKNIEKYLQKTMPFENTLKEAREIENIHNLLKNNGKKFDLSDTQLDLVKRLV